MRTRHATPRRYLMCPPTYFDVVYAINEWMDPTESVDVDLAYKQWERLRRAYLDLGAEVGLVDPVPGLPDMVFVCDSGVVVDGVVLGARYRASERAPETDHVLRWLRAHGYREAPPPRHINEGEGDFLVIGDTILAGTGFRSDERSHAELGAALGREVVTLHLVEPRFYHLNTALGILDDDTIAYLPRAFTPESCELLARRFPDAIVADDADADWLGLNLVSDGLHVVLAQQAEGLSGKLAAAGFEPVGVDVSEFRKSGGGIKCTTMELRA